MKKILIFHLLMTMSIVAFSQESVSLTIKLNPIQSLVVNNSQKNVKYSAQGNYQYINLYKENDNIFNTTVIYSINPL